jgi:hypothetical protein
MEPGIGKDLAILFLGSAIGIAPWFLDKTGWKLPRIAIVLGGWVALAAFSWGTAKLLSLAVPERTLTISLPGIVLLCIAICVGTLWSFAILRPAPVESHDSAIEASYTEPVGEFGYIYAKEDAEQSHPICPRCYQENRHVYTLTAGKFKNDTVRRCPNCQWQRAEPGTFRW